MSYNFLRAKYIEARGNFGVFDLKGNSLKTFGSSQIPTSNVSDIVQEADKSYLGGFLIDKGVFVFDNIYDNDTGYIWVSGRTWDIPIPQSKK